MLDIPALVAGPCATGCRALDGATTVDALMVVVSTRGGAANHRAIHIGVVDYGTVHVHHGSVVVKYVAGPDAAEKPAARVAKSIVNPAVETDL